MAITATNSGLTRILGALLLAAALLGMTGCGDIHARGEFTTLVMDKSDAVGTTWVDSNENGQADAGIDLIVFAFSLTNNANVTLSDIVINDPLLGGILSGSGVPTELDAGETTTFAINYFLTQDDVDAHHVFNSATASAHDPSNNFVNALAQFDVLLP